MGKRKVAIISVASYPRIGGMTTWMDKIASLLTEEEFDVRFYAIIEEYDEKIFQSKYEVKPVISSMKYPKALGQYIPKLIRWTKLNLYFLFSDDWIKNCDVIISDMTPGICSLAFRLKKRLKKPNIVIFGGDIFYETKNQFYANYLHKLLVKIFQESDAVIVDGYDHKENLIKRGVDESRIKVLVSGVDLNLYCEKPNPEQFIKYLESNQINVVGKRIILFFGRLVKENGVDLIPEIVKDIPDSVCIIIGQGILNGELSRIIKEEKLNIKLAGVIDKELLISALGLADVCIFPFRKIAGISQVLPEAMACGRAIVTTKAGAIDSLIQNNENGFLCDAENVQEIRNTLLKLLQDRDLRARIGAQARKTIEKSWDLDVIKKEYAKIVNSVIT